MYRIGIDLGGTNIAVGVVNEEYEIVAEVSLPTGAQRPAEQVVADMCRAVELAMEKAGITAAHCASIGIGSPGTCDGENGVVARAYNLGWFNVPVCAMMTEHFGLPCHLSNDANCAALAETVAGAAVGCRSMVLITLGTGVGGGIIQDGRIISGVGGTGAEVGHALLVLDGEPCTCGRNGCWEAYASATALIRQGKRAAQNATSTWGMLAESLGATIVPVNGDAETFELIKTGRADLTLNAETAFNNYMTAHPEEKVKIVARTDSASSSVVPVPKGSGRFLEAVNKAIEELRADGTLSALSLKYFGFDYTQE